MKKFFSLIATIVGLAAGAQDDKIYLQQFLNSAELSWEKQNCALLKDAEIDISRSFVDYDYVNSSRIPVITIAFSRAGRYAGNLQAVKVSDRYDKLPRKEKYLMLYRDLSGYDEAAQSGVVRIYDLNYNDYMAVETYIEQGQVASLSTWARKDGFAVDGVGRTEDEGKHYCDADQNGDVSFGECASCMIRACQQNTACNLLCTITNLLGNVACTKSLLASCLIIAVLY
jgi:hypothetical protein